MNAATADFAATAPWKGITGKPATFPSSPADLAQGGALNQSLLIYSAAAKRWVPVTPATLAALLRQFYHFTAADVGLGNVDNTSDNQKNSAIATLTNKTILGAIIRGTLQFGILAPTGFDLLLATQSSLSADRTLTLDLDDTDRSIELRASLVLAGDDTLTVSVNGAPRLVDLEGDLTLRGGDLVLELSDGTGSGEDRTLALDGDLTIHCFAALRTLNLAGDLTLGGDFTTTHAIVFAGAAAVFTLTGLTTVTFPTTGTLATLAGAETLTNKNIITPTGIVKGDVGLGNADNTSDANKPVSTAQATSIATKQPLTGNSFTVAGLPAAASNVGRMVYCTDGDGGAPCGALSDGTNWKIVALGATVHNP